MADSIPPMSLEMHLRRNLKRLVDSLKKLVQKDRLVLAPEKKELTVIEKKPKKQYSVKTKLEAFAIISVILGFSVWGFVFSPGPTSLVEQSFENGLIRENISSSNSTNWIDRSNSSEILAMYSDMTYTLLSSERYKFRNPSLFFSYFPFDLTLPSNDCVINKINTKNLRAEVTNGKIQINPSSSVFQTEDYSFLEIDYIIPSYHPDVTVIQQTFSHGNESTIEVNLCNNEKWDIDHFWFTLEIPPDIFCLIILIIVFTL